MKIAIRAGHNFLAKGASALIDETTEARKVKDSAIKYLQQLGHTVLDVTPGNMDSDSDLVCGVSKANNWGADVFISIHFNKAYNTYNGVIGTETWVYSNNDNFNDEEYAARIVNAIEELGFKNRGVKESIDLYELKATKMPSVIVEVCFVEATGDVKLYKNLGHDAIGKSIAEAISNKKIKIEPSWKKNNIGWWYDLGNGTYPTNKWMEINNEWYWFDEKGYAYEEKWLKYKNRWYWFNKDCKMVKNCVLKINNKYYAFNIAGEMIEGSVKVNSNGDLIL